MTIITMSYFNPRSPDGERLHAAFRDELVEISIHAPRMGSDQDTTKNPPHPPYFNPRSPDGERPSTRESMSRRSSFQSTLPGWGATVTGESGAGRRQISIHAPRMGSDRGASISGRRRAYFNPRSPDGERQILSEYFAKVPNFNPRSPDGERR